MVIAKKQKHLAWVEVDLNALKYNYRQIVHYAKNVFLKKPLGLNRLDYKRNQILGVIKAEAYGHGMLEIAKVLNHLGMNFFGVSDVQEGVLLRKDGIKKSILLFENILPEHLNDVVQYDLIPTIGTVSMAASLNKYAKLKNKVLNIHVNIDTGMGRLGVQKNEVKNFIQRILTYRNLNIQGLYTHFPVADTDKIFTKNQIKYFYALLQPLFSNIPHLEYIHAANSMGLTGGYNISFCNLARPGLMLYGLYPHPRLARVISLKPVMCVKTRIVFIKQISKGEGISYGHSYIAKKNKKIAVLSIGYSDGYFRHLSNKASVLINHTRCPVLGRVTMDQIMVDISKIKYPRIGMEVLLLGGQDKNIISADELAQHAQTINYEILCNLGKHLPRIYKGR